MYFLFNFLMDSNNALQNACSWNFARTRVPLIQWSLVCKDNIASNLCCYIFPVYVSAFLYLTNVICSVFATLHLSPCFVLQYFYKVYSLYICSCCPRLQQDNYVSREMMKYFQFNSIQFNSYWYDLFKGQGKLKDRWILVDRKSEH